MIETCESSCVRSVLHDGHLQSHAPEAETIEPASYTTSKMVATNVVRETSSMCTIFSRGMSIDASWLCTVPVSPTSGLTCGWQLPVSLPSCAWEQACGRALAIVARGRALAIVARHGKCRKCGYGLTVLA